MQWKYIYQEFKITEYNFFFHYKHLIFYNSGDEFLSFKMFRCIITSRQHSCQSVFGRSTGNEVSGHYFQHHLFRGEVPSIDGKGDWLRDWGSGQKVTKWVFYGYFKLVVRVSQGLFLGCFKCVSRVFWGVLKVLWGCFEGVLRVFQGYFKGLLRLFWGCFKDV